MSSEDPRAPQAPRVTAAQAAVPPVPAAPLTLGPDWAAVDWVLTDVDDTLTLHGRLPSESLRALESLREQGLRVVAVTGACAGWCDHIAHAWPVDAVLGENGAFVMEKIDGRLQLESDRPLAQVRADQARLLSAIETILLDHPGLGLTLDQAYRLCEVAIDIGQNRPHVDEAVVQAVLDRIHALGAHATASSIHINAWYGDHSKRVTALRYLAHHGIEGAALAHRVCCIGDSPNDQALFSALPLSVGVGNIRRFWSRLEHHPAVLTQAHGGHGFAEFSRALIAARTARA